MTMPGGFPGIPTLPGIPPIPNSTTPGDQPQPPPNPPGLPSIPQVLGASNPPAGDAGGTTPHLSLMVVVGEVVFVCIMVILSQQSPTLETLVTTVLVGLWLVYLVNQGPNLVNALRIRR